MISKQIYMLAPWVLIKDNILLGARLKAIKVSHLNIPDIPTEQLHHLIQNKYILDKDDFIANINKQTLPKFENGSGTQSNWIWITDYSFLIAAIILRESLLKLGCGARWQIVLDINLILNNLSNNHVQKPLVLRLSHKEPIDKAVINKLYSKLLNRTQIVWVGESTDGTHLGPIISNSRDLDMYLLATKTWNFSKQLISFGFKRFWPLPIYPHIVDKPLLVAEAIAHIIQAPSGTCWLIEENKKVCLWSRLLKEKISESEFFATQFWSKGLIRNFQVEHFNSINTGYISKCRSPCRGDDYLEGNSGKGIDLKRATYTLVGEAVERFAAWQSNKKIINSSDQIEHNKIIYGLEQFHPFGYKWENYLKSSQPALPLYEVKNELNTNETCLVPECLIPFPYIASVSEQYVTTSSTSGLAVYSDYEQAVIRGTLELFERNDFYNCFLRQKVGLVLDFKKILPQLKIRLPAFEILINNLISNKLQYWCIVYNTQSSLPIVHCFIFDQGNHFFSRGSGSGYTLLEAVTSSLVEALQIRQQFLKNSVNEVSEGYQDWRKPNVIEQIQKYLAKFQVLPFAEHPLNSFQYTPGLLLNVIKNELNILQKPLLVADLPCPIKEWSAVRVLLPGFTTHQYPSQSNGGKNILNPVFKYAIPT